MSVCCIIWWGLTYELACIIHAPIPTIGIINNQTSSNDIRILTAAWLMYLADVRERAPPWDKASHLTHVTASDLSCKLFYLKNYSPFVLFKSDKKGKISNMSLFLVGWDYQSVLHWQSVCKLLGPDRLFQARPASPNFAQLEEASCRWLSSVLVPKTPVSLCGPRWQHGFKNLPHPPPPPPLHIHKLAQLGRRTALGWAPTWLHSSAWINALAHLFPSLPLQLPLPLQRPAGLHLVSGLEACVARPESSSHRITQRLLVGI